MNDLNAGLHVGPRPVVGNRTGNTTQPKTTFQQINIIPKNQTAKNKRACEEKKTAKDLITNGPELVVDDPLPDGLNGASRVSHLMQIHRAPNAM